MAQSSADDLFLMKKGKKDAENVTLIFQLNQIISPSPLTLVASPLLQFQVDSPIV
jgi:hypothetical protein